MINRLEDFKNKSIINKFLSFLPDTSWRIYNDCSIDATKYRDAYDKIIKIGIDIYSSITTKCNDCYLENWMNEILGIKSDSVRNDTTWLIPFLANSKVWCEIEVGSLSKLIKYRIDHIRFNGICIIDTNKGIVYDFECGEDLFECRILKI